MNPYNDEDYWNPERRKPPFLPYKDIKSQPSPRPKAITKDDLRQETQDKINKLVDKHVLTINAGLRQNLNGITVFYIHTNRYREEILSELVRVYTEKGWKVTRKRMMDNKHQIEYDTLTLS